MGKMENWASMFLHLTSDVVEAEEQRGTRTNTLLLRYDQGKKYK